MSTHLHDLPTAAAVATGFAPATITETETGPSIDLADADGPCFAVQLVGDLAADTTLSGALEQSADGTSWSAVSGGAFTPVSAGPAVEVIRFTHSTRYVRWAGTPDGGAPSSAAVAVVIGQQKKVF